MVVGAGEGRSLASLGRPRDILRCNVRFLVMRLSPIASVGTDQCAIFRIVATVMDYFSLLVTACHRVSLPGICPRWKERASSHTIRWKERASSQSRKHVFHPDEFLRSRVTGQSTSGSTRMQLPFPFPSHTYVCTHTRTQPTINIDGICTLSTVICIYSQWQIPRGYL